MHRCLLLLLIVLLPLRAWAGDVMALAAVSSPAVAVAAVQTKLPPCHGDRSAAMDHGAGPHAMAPLASGPAANADHTSHTDGTGHHTGCSSCDICHGSVLSSPLACSSAPPVQASRPACNGVRFASAVLPGQHKPPIA